MMNKQRLIPIWCVATFVALMAMPFMAQARGRKAPVLTAQGEKIAAEYTKMLEDLKQEIVSLAPKVDEKVKAEFTKQFSTLKNIEPVTVTVMKRPRTLRYGPAHPAFAEKQIETLAAARAVMKDIDAFLVGEKALAIMAKFALLTHATPECLAGFA